MRSIVTDYLTDAIHDVDANRAGALAVYIPELANAEAEHLVTGSSLSERSRLA